MKHISYVCFVLVLMLLAGCGASPWVGINKRIDGRVKKIFAADVDGTRSQTCSASMLDVERGFLLTAAHCVPARDESVTLWVDDKRAYVVLVDLKIDLAILQASEVAGRNVVFAEQAPAIGEDVAIVGYPLDSSSPKFTFGHVSDLADISHGRLGQFLDVMIIPGDSGGIVVNAKGEVVGVPQGHLMNSFGTPVLAYVSWLSVTKRFVEPYVP
jgi:S1-C subfamily serine protease